MASLDVPGVAFMTMSETFALLAGIEASEDSHFALALSTGAAPGHRNQQLDIWMLTEHNSDSFFKSSANYDNNPFLQATWTRVEEEEMQASLWSAQVK